MQDDLLDLIRRAESGDDSALPVLRAIVTQPGIAEALGGNLARSTCEAMVARHAGKNLVLREATLQKMKELRTDLEGATPTPLEKLLVERVVVCWLHLHQLESEYVQKGKQEDTVAEFYQKSIDRAQKRYLVAIQSLATVRKLAAPVLQVNIAKRQVNIAGPTA